ncbi:MAG: hypothetical protein ABSE99_00595 [Terracidiphilus sp.]|jgi:hypothetical protein
MGLAAWLDLDPMDVFVFMVCGLLGFVLGLLLPAGAWAIYGSILLSYHLFLAWLVVTADHQTGFSLPVVSTILTHAACLTLVIALALGRQHIPFFGFIRYGIAGLALFERGWLFSGNTKMKMEAVANAPLPDAVVNATGEDYEQWLKHLATRNPMARKPGTSLKDEYHEWLVTRAKSRSAAPTIGPQA